MKLWRRAAGAIKDRNSIFLAGVARRSLYRHPELEAAIIKATSHDDLTVDYKHAQRVFQWLRASPSTCLKPLVYSLSRRVQKTRSWVVALKALILIHGVFCCKLAAVRRIGRLPFDLSGFVDGHSRPAKTWAYSAFVRVYFAFLDQRAVNLCAESETERWKQRRRSGPEEDSSSSVGEELLKLQKWQNLLDLLIQIKPMEEGMGGDLILEAMDCVIIEIFDVYSSLCDGIARVLVRIYGARAFEASIALRVLKKATAQNEKLTAYFEMCREIGVLNAKEFPKVEQIPEEDIREVERIISEISERSNSRAGKNALIREEQQEHHHHQHHDGTEKVKMEGTLQTVITDKWEVFDDDLKVGSEEDEGRRLMIEYPHHYRQQEHVHNEDYPDLISF